MPAGANVKRTFALAIVRWIDEGWSIGVFGSRSGVFFCNRGSERRQVSIDANDPARPLAQRDGWHHPAFPGREE